jgi:hypothetical protein
MDAKHHYLIGNYLNSRWAIILYLIPFLLYGASLFMPGIFYKPPSGGVCSTFDRFKSTGLVYDSYVFARTGKLEAGYYEYYQSGEPTSVKNGERLQPISNELMTGYCEGKLKFLVYEKGFYLLTEGWQGFFVARFAWFANLIFFVAAGFFVSGRYKTAAYNSGCAFLLGLDAFFFHSRLINEAGNAIPVDHLGGGFFLWELSFISLFLISIIARKYK